jgi:hypothetical protein
MSEGVCWEGGARKGGIDGEQRGRRLVGKMGREVGEVL